MNITDAIAELLNFLQRQASGAPREDAQSFVVSGDSWPTDASDGWQSMRDVHRWLVGKNLGACNLRGDISGAADFDTQDAGIEPGDRWSFSINKNIEAGEACFLTLAGFVEGLRKGDLSATRTIRICGNFQPFSTYRAVFLPLEVEDVDMQPEPWKGEDDPRQIVRVLSEGAALPRSIAFWLPCSQTPSDDRDVYRCWRGVAIEKLGLSLPHEIMKRDGLEVTIKGPRKLTLAVEHETPNTQDLFDQLIPTVRWVYESADHLSSRHDLLIHHLVVEWGDSRQWFKGLTKHLEEARRNAADSFRFYLAGETKEVLASLADLRKAMFDEVTQVSKDITELVSTLWKDLALVIGAVLINLIPKGNELQRPEIIYRVVSGFIIVHFLFRIITSGRQQILSARERDKWKRRLFKYIEESDYKELVDKPITSHLRTFWGSAGILMLLYVSLTITLWNPPSFLIARPGT
ncbi:MAG: hypothetical protein AB7P69_25420, partial [Candidatus Binatia bacterium]